MAQELKAEWGRSLPGDLLKRWPRDADGELVDAKLREQLAGFVQGFATFAAARRR